MRKYRFIATCTVVLSLATVVHAADSARLITYQHDGTTDYALSLMADVPEKEVPQAAVVVLFDTSASQQGEYREAAFAALETLLAGLNANDQVELMGVDLKVNRVTSQLSAPQSKEVKTAIGELRKQVPLGSTDMASALAAAVEVLSKSNAGQRTIVYIGDGISTANLLDKDTMATTLGQLRAAKTSVSSFAVGPRLDTHLLATLANQTGGNLTIQQLEGDNLRNAQLAGKDLISAVRGRVLWPTEVSLPAELGQVYPAVTPPLRSDRDTILIGVTTDKLSESVDLSITTDAGKINWNVAPEASSDDHAFLAQVVEIAKVDNGQSLPTVGSAGLVEVARLIGAHMDQLTEVAERAAASGDNQSARRIAEAVLRGDPGNVQARTVQAVAAVDAPAAPVIVPPQGLPPQGSSAPAVPPQGDISLVQPEEQLLGPEAHDGEFLDQVEQERRVYAEMLSKEIQNTILKARSFMSTDPQIAIQDMKLALDSVRRAPDLSPEKRAELTSKLEIALREAQHQAFLKDELDREREEQVAAARESQVINERLEQRIERVKQLMERFNALMDERRYQEAVEVAQVVEEADPGAVTPRVAGLYASFRRHYYLQQVARAARWANFWDTMYQNELSHIPFPDNPPIVYPDVEEWEDLTARRKKFASVDLSARSKAEENIQSALRSPLKAPLQYEDQPLNEIIDTLIDEYDIPIMFDNAALEEVAISPDTEITVNLRNVSLRSALNIMLRQPGLEDLTYTIDDEVLMITTEEKANEALKVKVYPVADLVLPIQSMGMTGGMGGMMGGMGGGMMGGMGGGMGGGMMGGMGGGMGGGMMGGMGGGMGGMGGGGMFNVADDAESTEPAQPQPATKALPVSAAQPATPDQSGDWATRFAQEKVDPAEVRTAIRDLMKQGQHDQAIGLIQAAIQNGQSQPWMYESLGIAMELAGRSKDDIERAVMSACDFSTSPDQLMLIANYLSHIGLDGRALEVYRQVAKLPGLHPEAYALGLRAAQRTENAAGIRWATVGILENAWPAEQQEIYDTAYRVAEATLEKMEAAKDPAAADYRSQLEKALARDVVIQVSWTGDADVDLLVEEPGGTVCSLQQPRTTGGGVCAADVASTASTSEKAAGLNEKYENSKAFPGTYRARLRKIYGDVVAGKVLVEVYKHKGTDRQQYEKRYVDIKDDSDTMVVFELEDGRRLESLQDQEVQVALKRQEAVSQKVLAQQLGQRLGDLSDPRISPYPFPLGGDLRRRMALNGQIGAVGFQPIIQTLPDGVQMMAQAVVSADRRYVRVTSSPSFTGIGDVQTFSFASQVQSGGGGGFGGGIGGGGGGI